jgi:pyruvate/2-oxoglutarate dehydrogenase complex dihydrolipoamide acyltransferase (E2) component
METAVDVHRGRLVESWRIPASAVRVYDYWRGRGLAGADSYELAAAAFGDQARYEELRQRAQEEIENRPPAVAAEESDVTKTNSNPPPEVLAAHERYLAGESVKALAEEQGISWQKLSGLFRKHDLERRPPLGNDPATLSHHRRRHGAETAVSQEEATADVGAPTSELVARVNKELTGAPAGDAAGRLEQLAAVRDLVRDLEAAGADVDVKFSFSLDVRWES